MKCSATNCTREATCFYLGWGRTKALRCDVHRDVKITHYAIEFYKLDNKAIEVKCQPLPPPTPPESAKRPKGFGDLVKPSPAPLLRILKSGLGPQLVGRWLDVPSYWYLEDMIYPGFTTVVLEGEPFFGWMNKVKSSLGFAVCRRNFEDLGWNRDPVLRTIAGPSLFLERELPKNTHFALPPHYATIWTRLNDILGGVRSARQAISYATFFGVHNESVAGGNVITACNAKGKLRFIVGEVAALSVFAETACPTLEAAKARIVHLLLGGNDPSDNASVVFVPQWAYHIDLQLLYLGRGTFAMHSFYKQQELVNAFFFKEADEARRGQLQRCIADLIQRYGDIQNATRDVLEAQGFRVIEVAGIFPTSVDHGHIKKPLFQPDGLAFCFLNGLSVFPDKVLIGHNVDTKSQFIELAYELFKDELADAGFEAVPIGNHLKCYERDVQAYMQKEEGGLRCRSTTLPTAAVEEHL